MWLACNCIGGGTIEAEIQLDGRVSSTETLCGEMNGMLYRPYPADLGYSEITMERSLGAIKINGDEDINAISIPKNCDDVSQNLQMRTRRMLGDWRMSEQLTLSIKWLSSEVITARNRYSLKTLEGLRQDSQRLKLKLSQCWFKSS